MTKRTHNGGGGANAEQTRLANSLVEALGLDGAISACRANGWDGVLACLLGPQQDAGNFRSPGARRRA